MELSAKHYRVIEDYQSPYPHPINFHKGEVVQVGEEFTDDPDWKDWVWCEGEHGKKAWAPKQYLKTEAGRGVFLNDYNARELSVTIGEVITVYEVINGFGMSEKQNGERGWVPLKNLQPEEV